MQRNAALDQQSIDVRAVAVSSDCEHLRGVRLREIEKMLDFRRLAEVGKIPADDEQIGFRLVSQNFFKPANFAVNVGDTKKFHNPSVLNSVLMLDA
jgi:hypothetical protein